MTEVDPQDPCLQFSSAEEGIVAISFKNARKSFASGNGDPVVIGPVNFDVRQGEVVGLFGPSGCGKTTLLRVLCGILKLDEGEALIFQKPIDSGTRNVAYVPQGTQLLEWKTLWDNALLGWRITRVGKAMAPKNRGMWRNILHRRRPGSNGQDSDATMKRARELFERFGLESVSSKFPAHASGGERQRVALIRALLTPAPIMLLDEPVGALDHINRVRIFETLLSVVDDRSAAQGPRTILTVSHDPEELLLLCDRVIVLSQRPFKVKKIVPVCFPRPRDPDLRFLPEFVALKRELWSALK